MSIAIDALSLSKCYALTGSTAAYGRLTEAVVDLLRRRRRREATELWALRDVSFQLAHGEVIGLIGRNGAGKSTLLKLLSRITAPTTGTATIDGRVGSLLEVGTGFHPELSGRENVLLNAAIIGMSYRETKAKLGAIVEFAELEEFIDEPVKHYSSGMYMRLAFSVAAHLEAEILLVDEVLAVGDQEFQRRCLGKMDEVARRGRAVIFVSHNLGSIAQLCPRTLWLEGGCLRADGSTDEIVAGYLVAGGADRPSAIFDEDLEKDVQILEMSVRSAGGAVSREIGCDEEIVVGIDVVVRRPVRGGSVAFWLRNHHGVTVLSSDILHADSGASDSLSVGAHRFEIDVPPRLLAPADYYLSAAVLSPYHGRLDDHPDSCVFGVVDHSTRTGATRAGVIGLNLPWRHVPVRQISEEVGDGGGPES